MQILLDIFPAHFQIAPPQSNTITDVDQLQAYPPTQNKHKNTDVRYLSTTRVILTNEVIAVAQDTPQGAVIVFQERYETCNPEPTNKTKQQQQNQTATTTYRVTTASGKMLAFQKDTNCGCGSRLRSWNPYKTLNV